jgi:hypothetical protein
MRSVLETLAHDTGQASISSFLITPQAESMIPFMKLSRCTANRSLHLLSAQKQEETSRVAALHSWHGSRTMTIHISRDLSKFSCTFPNTRVRSIGRCSRDMENGGFRSTRQVVSYYNVSLFTSHGKLTMRKSPCRGGISV